MTSNSVLEIKHIKKYFKISKGWFAEKKYVKAVDDVSFSIEKGTTVSIVGESGCGKSTLARLVNGLIEADSGEVIFKGNNLTHENETVWRTFRQPMQMIFQDPYASLSPHLKIKDIVAEPLNIHYPKMSKSEREKIVKETLDICGVGSQHLEKYPHQFSGGQRQRIGIARALVLRPELVILDEPVSALDVSVQAQILNLLKDLQEKFDLTFLFISHDLSVVDHISNNVAVMYLGNIVEIASRDTLFEDPKHPYTQALLSSVPDTNPKLGRERVVLKGEIPNAANPPAGCKFHTRCPFAMDVCKKIVPEMQTLNSGTQVACHLYGENQS
ncbi:ABC transporter ATP-binding protein [Oceanobacillus timonensis]|uniref:ABC transporter ATP-binding protein n=1 Tax=Oceanobacillus timonensis TaxID=1926285 RepID=UPI001FE771CE|nr:dipeptide ABC transporter ATP-binding protein [Oceanobacillus timonensis]